MCHTVNFSVAGLKSNPLKAARNGGAVSDRLPHGHTDLRVSRNCRHVH
jgi:hypothetical protein